jgi:hypothetical protein
VTTDDLAEPIEAIPVGTSAGSPLATAFAWVAVAAALLLIGSWVWTRWIDPPVGGTIEKYVDGTGGVAFEDPGAGFRVTMPTRFQRSIGTNPWGQVVTVSDDPGGGYGFSVTKTPQPSSALENYVPALNRLAGQLASDQDAEIVHQIQPLALGDVGYKDLVFRKGDTYWRVQLQLLRDRLYTLVAKAPNADEGPYKRLGTSFQILGAR